MDRLLKNFFISYNHNDRDWAEWIAWQLEEVGYSVIIQAWDFRPGSNFVVEMQVAMTLAERTIAVLSPAYVESAFAASEWAGAFARDPKGEKGVLLPVRVSHCEPKGLLTQIVYIDLVGLDEISAREALFKGIEHKRDKPSIPPRFPSIQSAIARFSPVFATHPQQQTRLVDYASWHEDETDWQTGNGLLCAGTYGELFHIWTTPSLFVTYEAHLLRFIKRGGTARRIFFLGPYLSDASGILALQRTLLRHFRLGFQTRVKSVLDLRAEVKQLEVRCDMFGVLNGRVAYLIQFPEGNQPLMLRTTQERTVQRVENCFGKCWREAEDAQSWYKRQATMLPSELLKQVDLDVAAVTNVGLS